MRFRLSLSFVLPVVLLSACTVAAAAMLCMDAEAVTRMAGLMHPDEEAYRWEGARQRLLAYQRTLAGAVDDLHADRCTLGEAVDRLAATERACDPDCARQLRSVYGGATQRENLAASLLNHALIERPATPADWQHNRDLLAEFRSQYGHRPRLFCDLAGGD